MNNSKFIELLKNLSPAQWKQLLYKVQHAVIPCSRRATACLLYLSKLQNSWAIDALSKEKIYAAVFPTKKFNDPIFRQTISEAKEIVHQFMLQAEMAKDERMQQLLLQKAYRNAGLQWRQKQVQKSFVIDDESYLHEYMQAVEQNKSKSIIAQNKSRKTEIALSATYKSLETYYWIERLKLSIDAVNFKNILGQHHEVGDMQMLLLQIEKEATPDQFIILMYANILSMLLDFSREDKYQALKLQLFAHWQDIDKSMAKYMFGMAQNFCIRNINAGKTNYLQEIFELFQFQLTKEILLEQNILATWDYKNIVTTGLRLKEFEWTFQFIEQYKLHLENNSRENAYTYNLAKYYFEKGDYKKVLKGLVDVVYTDVFYHLDASILLMKSYYLMDEIEAMFNVMDTLKIFILRQKQLSKYQAQTYLNFMKYLKKISNTSVYDKARIQKISDDMAKEKVIADIGWLKSILQQWR